MTVLFSPSFIISCPSWENQGLPPATLSLTAGLARPGDKDRQDYWADNHYTLLPRDQKRIITCDSIFTAVEAKEQTTANIIELSFNLPNIMFFSIKIYFSANSLRFLFMATKRRTLFFVPAPLKLY